MSEFRATFKQHQHPPWKKFYIDLHALGSTAEEPGSAPRLRDECDKALAFMQGRVHELQKSIDAMQQELDGRPC